MPDAYQACFGIGDFDFEVVLRRCVVKICKGANMDCVDLVRRSHAGEADPCHGNQRLPRERGWLQVLASAWVNT